MFLEPKNRPSESELIVHFHSQIIRFAYLIYLFLGVDAEEAISDFLERIRHYEVGFQGQYAIHVCRGILKEQMIFKDLDT